MRARARPAPDRAPHGARSSARAAEPGALALQRSIGNRATAQLLARREKAVGSVTLDDFDDPIPILEVNHDHQAREVVLTSYRGGHSPRLSHRILDGQRFAYADILLRHTRGDLHIVLSDAFVGSYTIDSFQDGATEHWSLAYEDIKYIQPSSGPIPE